MFTKKKENSVHVLIMEQINDVENCLVQFQSFIRAASTPQTGIETLRTLEEGIANAEAVADKSLRKMIDSLSGGSFLPSTRQDLISIATSCDKVANKCELYAKKAVCQKFIFPADFTDDLTEIVSITIDQFAVLEKSISRLFSDFGQLLKDHTILDEIRKLETKVDVIELKLYDKVFSMDIGLAERMQMTQFIETICDISDVIENIADKIQIMLVSRKA